MKYAFTDEYLTGIESIDKEHEHLFAIANEVYDLLQNQLLTDKYDKIVNLLGELKEYTRTHFANEEAYMESINYQHIWSERHQHRTFEQKLDEIDLAKLDDSQEAHILEILDFLTKWLGSHIKGADRRIGITAGTVK